MEQGLFPHTRTLNDPLSLEEERRLCYVGITRAQEQLFLTHARERRLWGAREPAVASQFLYELPEELVSSNLKASAYRRRTQTQQKVQSTNINWSVGDRVFHQEFGEGEVTHILGSGNKITLAIKFPSLGATKIMSQTTPMEKID
jgi:DNA helicase-2/ATP-dependent DNA helicase PcrA